MRYGYCRTSKPKQSIERQIRNIKSAYPDAVIVQEVFTRTRLDRPEWLKLMRRIQPGDEIVFDSVSRMSGDAKEGFAAYEELYQKGVNLVYLKEPHINTETYKKALENNIQLTGSNVDYILEGVNRYLLELAKEQIRLAFEQSEKEVQDLHQRTREGIETARLNGKQITRKGHVATAGRVGTLGSSSPNPGNHCGFATTLFCWNAYFWVEVTNSLKRLFFHPLAIITYVLSKAAGTLPITVSV